MKFYGVLSYVWLNPDNIILNNLKEGLIDGILISSIGYCDKKRGKRYRKWITRNILNKNIKSIIVDHEAWGRFKKKPSIIWSYERIKSYQSEATRLLQKLPVEVITIAPDLIGEDETSYDWACKFKDEFSSEFNIIYPLHGRVPEGVERVGIPKENLEKNWKEQLIHNNYKLHGLGVSPRNMPMLKEENFYSCDATIDSDGWQRIRIEDFINYDSSI